MFALTVLEECNAQNDNVPDEPRLKIIQVGMLISLCTRRMKNLGSK